MYDLYVSSINERHEEGKQEIVNLGKFYATCSVLILYNEIKFTRYTVCYLLR